jgi:hypothetical protein
MSEAEAPLEITLRRGGSARLIVADSEHVSLDAPLASPPGSTLEFVVENSPLGVKVQSCRKISELDPPRYRIEGRWVNLSRPQREALGIRQRRS